MRVMMIVMITSFAQMLNTLSGNKQALWQCNEGDDNCDDNVNVVEHLVHNKDVIVMIMLKMSVT